MNVTLTPDMDKLIEDQLERGTFSTPVEIINEALRLLAERQTIRETQQEELRREIGKGITSLDQGKGRIVDRSLVDEICERGMTRLARARAAGQ